VLLAESGITKNVRLHDVRHTTVDLLDLAGVPDDIIMEIVGHSTRQMTQQYKSRGNRERLTKAMQQLSALFTQPSEGTASAIEE
jgi:integrase